MIYVWDLDGDIEERGSPSGSLNYSKNCSSLLFVNDTLVATSAFNRDTKLWTVNGNSHFLEQKSVLKETEGSDNYGASAACATIVDGKSYLLTFPEAMGVINVYDMDNNNERKTTLKTRVDRVMAFATTSDGRFLMTRRRLLSTQSKTKKTSDTRVKSY